MGGRAASFLVIAALSMCVAAATSSQPGAEFRDLFVAVKQRNELRLQEMLYTVSDPTSPRYGLHLSLQDVCSLISPDEKHVETVRQWAADNGAVGLSFSECKEFASLRMPSSRIPAAFSKVMESGLTCTARGCSRNIAVPTSLIHAVDFVDGLGGGAGSLSQGNPSTTRDYSPHRRRSDKTGDKHLSSTSAGAKPGPWYPKCLALSADPGCLKQLHNVTIDQATSKGGPSQGVALFGGQFYSPSDLDAFQSKYGVPHVVVEDLNDNEPGTPGNEASLDVQYITGLGAGVPTWFMHYACTTQDCKPFWSWMMQIANVTDPPMVQSVSVGTTEYEYITEMGAKFVRRINAEFVKAGVRGISLIFASGDRASQLFDGKYWINFPSASPHVTAVGGVWLGELGGGPLVADPDTTGGFSNCEAHVRMPYQDAAVEDYLKEAEAEGAVQPKTFNASNRGVPDLVSMSDAFVIIQHGTETFIGGTSAACPVIAGMVSLINDARHAAKRPTLGFLNPFLYANPQCFQDITGGKNLYGATKGWDPASGLGTPIFSCLLNAAMQTASSSVVA